MNKGLFKLGTRELDCAELPAQNGIVQTLGTLYHCVHICSVSPCQTSLEKECRRGYKTVHCLGAKENVDPVPISSRELGHDHLRGGHWYPAPILSVGI